MFSIEVSKTKTLNESTLILTEKEVSDWILERQAKLNI